MSQATQPLHFPTSEEMPESEWHAVGRSALFWLLRDRLVDRHVGTDQFFYWVPTDPKQALAPDVYVCEHRQPDLVKSWKTWERGTPLVAIELVSDFDRRIAPWNVKIQRYAEMGVQELVRFDDAGSIRCWHRLNDELTEVATRYSALIEGTWCTKEALPWVRDDSGQLWPTPEERARAEMERAHAEMERAHAETKRAQTERDRALADSAELRAEYEAALERIRVLESKR